MIEAFVSGQSEVAARIRRFNDRLQPEMRVGIERLTVKLQNAVKADKLSGQALNVRTGRLRNSIARGVQESGQTITGLVSSAVVYAPAHEYGCDKTVDVKEHMRTQKMAFGKPIDPKTVTVRAHTMKMNLKERSFLRSALKDMADAGTIKSEMEAAVKRATAA